MTTRAQWFGRKPRQATGNAGWWVGGLVVTMLTSGPAGAEVAKGDPAGAVGGGAMARVLAPADKIKLLEEELARETDRRVKAEEESARRQHENDALVAAARTAVRERAAVEARLNDTRDRESQLQRGNDGLRDENQRLAMAVRLSLPIVTVACITTLVLLVWTILFLRKIAARVHDQRTLAEMRELEARLAHATDQYSAELKRNHTLRGKLAELGITDEETPPTPSPHRHGR